MFHIETPADVFGPSAVLLCQKLALSQHFVTFNARRTLPLLTSSPTCYAMALPLFTPCLWPLSQLTSRESAKPAENAKMKNTDARGPALVIVLAISMIVIAISGCSRGEVANANINTNI